MINPLWECLDDKAKEFVKSIMPMGWRPPKSNDVHIDKINKEMSRKPHYGKRRR